MSTEPESREEAIARLHRSASDLEARSRPPSSQTLAASAVVSEAYKIIAELIGGVALGLALGFVVDRYLPTDPWGLIGGVLLGFAVSIWMARRTANRLMEKAKAEGITPGSIPFDDEDDDWERKA